MKRKEGSRLPSVTFAPATSKTRDVSFSVSASSETSANSQAIFCPRKLKLKPSCMQSASCVVVCSFASTTAPMVLAWCTNLFRRRRAFLALRLSLRRSLCDFEVCKSRSVVVSPSATKTPSPTSPVALFSSPFAFPCCPSLPADADLCFSFRPNRIPRENTCRNAAGDRIAVANAPDASDDRGDRVGDSGGVSYPLVATDCPWLCFRIARRARFSSALVPSSSSAWSPSLVRESSSSLLSASETSSVVSFAGWISTPGSSPSRSRATSSGVNDSRPSVFGATTDVPVILESP
mmetsp:Transcript_8287/g.27576  ORF Transcript_8287/g.27576 Transcript_8287/m.27576 type:complete len:292 (-) Transcript_8287:265-1140(-)